MKTLTFSLLFLASLLFGGQQVYAQDPSIANFDYYYVGPQSCEYELEIALENSANVTNVTVLLYDQVGNLLGMTSATLDGDTATYVRDFSQPGTYQVGFSLETTAGDYGPFMYSVNIIAVGIADVDEHQFMLYPNPMTSELFIKNAEVGDQVTISNLIGKQVHSEKISDDKKQMISVKEFPVGIYLVTVKDKTFRVVKK